MSAVAQPVAQLSGSAGLPARLVDELADRLSARLADTVVERLLAAIAQTSGTTGRADDVPAIPEGASHATAAQLAARFQVSVQWIESPATDLGATPISDSPNSKLRYHVATADAYMQGQRRTPPTRRVTRRGGRNPKPMPPTHTRSGSPLLDVI
jgi:hypothetical protein